MSDEALTLHCAQPQDIGEIVAFIRELAEYEKLAHEMVANEESLSEWLFGQHPAAEVVIARMAGASIGFALFFTTFSTFLGRPGIYLEDLFVRPAYRGRGVGKALLQHLAELACERGYGRLEWSVLDWNEPAISFYEQMGAEPMDEWRIFRVSGDRLQLLARTSG